MKWYPNNRIHPMLVAATSMSIQWAAAQESTQLPEIDALPSQVATPDLPAELNEILPPVEEARPEPSTNVAVNLTALLVKKGLLTKEEGLALIAQAEAEAKAAAAATATAPSVLPAVEEDEVSVTYVPKVVRDNIRDEIKQEILAEASEQQWGQPEAAQWTNRIRPIIDLRTRHQSFMYADGNDNSGVFPNFNVINTGLPFDTTGNQFSPQFNVDQNRSRMLQRARFGAEIDIDDGFMAGIRMATGNGTSPVTTNQTLGGGPGSFSRYPLWLDRAFLDIKIVDESDSKFNIMLGRFDNPFFSTDVVWDLDIGFDGIGFKGNQALNRDLTFFYAGGLFPIFNTALDFAINQPKKFESYDKWLYGAQVGIDWRINEKTTARLASAYYDFDNIEGKLSSPFVPLTPEDIGDTDASRPGFAQRGNTYRPIRNILPTAANNFGTINQFQYYGLATPFQVISNTGRLDYDLLSGHRLSLISEYSRNIAFDAGSVQSIAVNNRNGSGAFDGGNNAYNMLFQFGKPAFEVRGDWSVTMGYRYVESDAVVDGFTDSEFSAGTNIKGFSLGGVMAINPHTRAGVRWMSCDEVSGAPFGVDIFQFELNANF